MGSLKMAHDWLKKQTNKQTKNWHYDRFAINDTNDYFTCISAPKVAHIQSLL